MRYIKYDLDQADVRSLKRKVSAKLYMFVSRELRLEAVRSIISDVVGDMRCGPICVRDQVWTDLGKKVLTKIKSDVGKAVIDELMVGVVDAVGTDTIRVVGCETWDGVIKEVKDEMLEA